MKNSALKIESASGPCKPAAPVTALVTAPVFILFAAGDTSEEILTAAVVDVAPIEEATTVLAVLFFLFLFAGGADAGTVVSGQSACGIEEVETPTAEDDDAPIADTADGVLSVFVDQKEVILLCMALTAGLTMLSI